jgi:hypothetical protein
MVEQRNKVEWIVVDRECPKARHCLPNAPSITLCPMYCGGSGRQSVARLVSWRQLELTEVSSNGTDKN